MKQQFRKNIRFVLQQKFNMNLKSLLLTTTLGAILSMGANASGDVKHYADPLRKIFIENPKQLPDYAYQNQLRNKPFWKQFASESGNWTAMFDESSGTAPTGHRKANLAVAGSSAKAVADNFLNNNLSGFNLPLSSLGISTQKRPLLKYRLCKLQTVLSRYRIVVF
jgi:hypothetical protein